MRGHVGVDIPWSTRGGQRGETGLGPFQNDRLLRAYYVKKKCLHTSKYYDMQRKKSLPPYIGMMTIFACICGHFFGSFGKTLLDSKKSASGRVVVKERMEVLILITKLKP